MAAPYQNLILFQLTPITGANQHCGTVLKINTPLAWHFQIRIILKIPSLAWAVLI